jgi:ABC-type transport system involved in multi-copper enzyme maturation permease subunit
MKEAVRRRSMLITLVLSLLFILAIGIFAQQGLKRDQGQNTELIRTFQIESTIRTLSFFGALLALFITMNAIPAEIERRTVYVLLSKPLERYQFILGKFLGCLLLLGINMALMAVVSFFLIIRTNPTVAIGLIRSFGILFISLTSLCSLVILLTTFMPAAGGALLGLGIYLTGKIPGSFKMIAESEEINALARYAAKVLYPIVVALTPRVNKLNFEAPVLESPDQIRAILLVLGYSALCLLIATVIFGRKEL